MESKATADGGRGWQVPRPRARGLPDPRRASPSSVRADLLPHPPSSEKRRRGTQKDASRQPAQLSKGLGEITPSAGC